MNPLKSLGYLALLAILLPTVMAFYALIDFDDQGMDWSLLRDDYFQGILFFSLKQALLSSLISVLLAWPIARALYYVPVLWGRRLFLSLCLLCFVLPTLVLITGLVALLGRSGWLTPLLSEDWNLYGLQGILLAHVFLNMPFAVRAIFLQLQSIPDTSWRLAAQLKFSGWQRFRWVEWPALSGRLLILLGFVFVLCFNSFAVVLALGGGPQATTLEVAIYQSLKYDFNIPEALTLAWVQFAIAGGLFLLMTRFGSTGWLSADMASGHYRPLASRWARFGYAVLYGVTWLVLLSPLLALLPGLLTIGTDKLMKIHILQPSLTSLALGMLCALLALGITWLVLLPLRQVRTQQRQRWQWLLEWLATHTLVAPAMVLSVGLYIFALRYFPGRIDTVFWSVLVVGLLNTVIIIPFAVQQLRPRLFQFDDQYQRLCDSLKLTAWQRVQIEWPWIRQTWHATFALVMLLAMGDVTIFSIFGTGDWMTLPWLIYSYAGTYRIPEASVVAFLLLLICGVIVMLFERNQSYVSD